MHRHQSTWLDAAELGSRFPPYVPTYDFLQPYIDHRHVTLATAPLNGEIIEIGIPGWLRPADALKLYELAYFAPGDVLEIGTYHGLSTSIQAEAMAARPGRRLVTLELDPPAVAEARKHTARWSSSIDIMEGDARQSCQQLAAAGRRFSYAFVDHSHSYELVLAACQDLKQLLTPGAFALFHDYNDARNGTDPDYGVWHAVGDAFRDGSAEFWGVYGCTGLWRMR